MISTPSVTHAQERIFKETFTDNYFAGDWGKNRKHYVSSYVRLGGVIRSADALATNGGGDFSYGLFYKRRFSNLSSMIFDYQIQSVSYKINDIGQIDPYSLLLEWDQETVSILAFGMDIRHRFNFGRRGDRIGKYVDLGGYGSWNIGRTHKYLGKDDYREIAATHYKADYLRKFESGLKFGVGYNWIGVYGRYRLTNLLNTDHLTVDLPRLVIGVEITTLW
jgi:hypothetical protein